MREIERRIVSTSVELRAKGPGQHVLTGYAALYDTLSEDLGFREVIRPGAFDRAIREKQDVLARAEHDSRMLLGRRSSDTLRLAVDGKGLKYEVDVPDTGPGRDLMTLVRRGDVRQSSFAFMVPNPEKNEKWTVQEDGTVLREILDVDLVDVAPVAMPAYSETTVSARSLEQARVLKSNGTRIPARPDPEPETPAEPDPDAPAEPEPAHIDTPEEEPAEEPEEPAEEARAVPIALLRLRNDLALM